jgi:three-Cys-motif partner protein
VSDDIIDELKHIETIPSLFFLDPWGYKGVSLKLIKFAIKPWGSECIFFFNYNRIQAAINNPQVQNLMIALFGKDRLAELRMKLVDLNSTEKELEIINTLGEALKDFGGKFSLPFCFKHAEQDRTSHYLIFVGKHPKGYSLIKEIMAKYSQKNADGVPSFTYEPKKNVQLEFTFNRPLKELADTLFTGIFRKSY